MYLRSGLHVPCTRSIRNDGTYLKLFGQSWGILQSVANEEKVISPGLLSNKRILQVLRVF
jgi:hypothetical protein